MNFQKECSAAAVAVIILKKREKKINKKAKALG